MWQEKATSAKRPGKGVLQTSSEALEHRFPTAWARKGEATSKHRKTTSLPKVLELLERDSCTERMGVGVG